MNWRWGLAAAGAACAACCAPFLIPLIAGAGLIWFSLDKALCLGAGAVLLAGAGVLLWRRRKPKTCGCDKSCNV